MLLTHGACVNNSSFDYARGGIWVEADYDGDGDSEESGTLTCTVKRNGNYYALTANHIFNPDGIKSCDGNWGDDLWQHYENADQHVGTVDLYREEMDYAILQLDDLDPGYDVVGSTWSGPIVTHTSDARNAELIEDGTTVEKMGSQTGGTTGELKSRSVSEDSGCVEMGGDGLRASCTVSPGDSEGPLYAESENSSGDIAMVGLVTGQRNVLPNGFDCEGDNTYKSFFGPPAWHMAQELNLEFN